MFLSRNLECQHDPDRGRTTRAIGETGGIGGAHGNTSLKGLKNHTACHQTVAVRSPWGRGHGFTVIPRTPCGAIVVKSLWRSRSSNPLFAFKRHPQNTRTFLRCRYPQKALKLPGIQCPGHCQTHETSQAFFFTYHLSQHQFT